LEGKGRIAMSPPFLPFLGKKGKMGKGGGYTGVDPSLGAYSTLLYHIGKLFGIEKL